MKFTEYVEVNPKTNLKKGEYAPFVEMANVSITYREPEKVEYKKYTSGPKFQNGDSVVARIEPCLQNGKRFFWKSDKIGFGSTEYIVFRAKEGKMDSKYLFYLLKTDYIKKSMVSSMVGATGRQRVNNDIFGQIEIVVPNIDKQKKIGRTLFLYDDLIENNQKQIQLLEEAARRLYKEWFVDLHFPGHENTKIVDGVPEGWNEKTLSQVANVIMGQSPKSEFYNSEKKGLPFHQGVGSYGVRFVMDDIYSTSYTRIAEPNSILFSVRAPVGRLNITKNKVVIGRGLAAINQTDGCQSYLYYLLKNKFFKDNIVGNGSIFASVSKDELLNQKFLIPERNLMMQFEKIVSQMDKQIENLDSKNKKLIEARDRLLPKLMSGEVEV